MCAGPASQKRHQYEWYILRRRVRKLAWPAEDISPKIAFRVVSVLQVVSPMQVQNPTLNPEAYASTLKPLSPIYSPIPSLYM